jgi:hypothetical protein
LSVAHKTGLALLCDLAALLVLCVLAHLARPVALGFVSDAQQDASDTRRRGWRCEKVFRGYVRVSHLAKTISAHLFASLTNVQRVRIPLWLTWFFSCAFSLLGAAYKTPGVIARPRTVCGRAPSQDRFAGVCEPRLMQSIAPVVGYATYIYLVSVSYHKFVAEILIPSGFLSQVNARIARFSLQSMLTHVMASLTWCLVKSCRA